MNEKQYSRILPLDFVPSSDHVIIGKGKKYSRHSGNIRLREMVAARIESYTQATSKSEKSDIISEMVYQVRSTSSYGGFVRKDEDTGRWFEADSVFARERISQLFRDELHMHYKSSRKNRRKGRSSDEDENSSQQKGRYGEGRAFSEDAFKMKKKGVDVMPEKAAEFGTKTKEECCSSYPIADESKAHSNNAIELERLSHLLWGDTMGNNDDDPFEPRPIRRGQEQEENKDL